jgi:hypothetical protein
MLEAVADRGYCNGDEIKMCVDVGITVTFAQADDFMDESGRLLWQGGFRVSGRGKCLSLSGRGETYIPFYDRRTWAEAAPVLDQCLPELHRPPP